MCGGAELELTTNSQMRGADEQQLVERSKRGEIAAFGELFRRNRDLIVGAIRRILRNSPDVEDVAHEVFLKAFHAISQFKGNSKLSSWLYPIALRTCLDHLRKMRPNKHESIDPTGAQMELEIEEPPGGAPADTNGGEAASYSAYRVRENDATRREEHLEILRKVREQLPPNHAKTMHLCHIEGHDAESAAQMAGLRDAGEVYEVTKKYSRLCLKEKKELEKRKAQARKQPNQQ